MNNSVRLATYVVVVLTLMSQTVFAALCGDIASKLSRVLDRSVELELSNRPGTTYKKLFDDCDSSDNFNGRRLPVLQGMKQACSTDPNAVSYIRKFKEGTIIFKAKMSVDADGSPVAGGPNAGPADQTQTALEFDNGSRDQYVNSEDIPYIVVPVDVPGSKVSFQRDTDVRPGDLALVLRKGKCSFAVVADTGPYFRIGEASLKVHEELGNPQCVVRDQHPCRMLIGDGNGISINSEVTYLLFPRSRPAILLSQEIVSVARTEIIRRLRRFLASQMDSMEASN